MIKKSIEMLMNGPKPLEPVYTYIEDSSISFHFVGKNAVPGPCHTHTTMLSYTHVRYVVFGYICMNII